MPAKAAAAKPIPEALFIRTHAAILCAVPAYAERCQALGVSSPPATSGSLTSPLDLAHPERTPL